MVNVTKGVLVECDPTMKQFLLHLDAKEILKKRFIVADLDETHLFVTAEVVEELQTQVNELMDKLNFDVVNIEQKS